MGLNVGELVATLKLETADFDSKLSAAGSNFKQLGQGLKDTGWQMTKYVTAPLAGIGVMALKSAMHVGAWENIFRVAMGDMEADARAFSESLREQFGLNAYEVRRNIGLFYNFSTSLGVAKDKAYEMSTEVVKLAYNMASYYDTPFVDMLAKIQSGLIGEIQPLKQLGISVHDAAVKQKALELGMGELDKKTGKMKVTLDQGEKAWLRYLLILDQTKVAQGDLARTIDAPANRLAILGQQVQQLAIDMGLAMMPAWESLLSMVQGAVGWLQGLTTAFANLGSGAQMAILGVVAFVAALGPMVMMLGQVMLALPGLIAIGGALGGLFAAIATPVGALVVAIAALSAGLMITMANSVSTAERLEDLRAKLSALKAAGYDEASQAVIQLKAQIQTLRDEAQIADQNINNLQNTIGKKLKSGVSASNPEILKMRNNLYQLQQTKVGERMKYIKDHIADLIANGVSPAAPRIQALRKEYDSLAAQSAKLSGKQKEVAQALAKSGVAVDQAASATAAASTRTGKHINAWFQTLKSDVATAIQGMAAKFKGLGANMGAAVNMGPLKAKISAGFAGAKSVAAMSANSIKNAVVNAFSSMAGAVSGAVGRVRAAIANGFNSAKAAAVGAIQALVSGCIGALQGGLARLAAIAAAGIAKVKAAFQAGYDAIVGHSIVPDMVKEVIAWFKKMHSAAARWSKKTIKEVVDNFKELNKAFRVSTACGKLQYDFDAAAAKAQALEQAITSLLEKGLASTDPVIQKLNKELKALKIEAIMHDYHRALREIEAFTKLGMEDNPTQAKIDAIKQAITDLIRMGLDSADPKVQELKKKLEELNAQLDEETKVKEYEDAIKKLGDTIKNVGKEIEKAEWEQKLFGGSEAEKMNAVIGAYKSAILDIVDKAIMAGKSVEEVMAMPELQKLMDEYNKLVDELKKITFAEDVKKAVDDLNDALSAIDWKKAVFPEDALEEAQARLNLYQSALDALIKTYIGAGKNLDEFMSDPEVIAILEKIKQLQEEIAKATYVQKLKDALEEAQRSITQMQWEDILFGDKDEESRAAAVRDAWKAAVVAILVAGLAAKKTLDEIMNSEEFKRAMEAYEEAERLWREANWDKILQGVADDAAKSLAKLRFEMEALGKTMDVWDEMSAKAEIYRQAIARLFDEYMEKYGDYDKAMEAIANDPRYQQWLEELKKIEEAFGSLAYQIAQAVKEIGVAVESALTGVLKNMVKNVNTMTDVLNTLLDTIIDSIIDHAIKALKIAEMVSKALEFMWKPGGWLFILPMLALLKGMRKQASTVAAPVANVKAPVAYNPYNEYKPTVAAGGSATAGGGVTQNIYLQVDGRTVAATVVKNMPSVIRLNGGG